MNGEALWIGAPDSAYPAMGQLPTQIVYFRRTFRIDGKCSVQMRISASSRYRLYVNGQFVAAGPCRGDGHTLYWDDLTLGEHLVQGDNVIAVKVVAYAPRAACTDQCRGPMWTMANGAGACLFVDGRVLDGSGGVAADISTGREGWVAQVDSAVDWRFFPMTQWIGSMEVVDGAKLPRGWMDSMNPAGEWHEAVTRFTGDEHGKAFGLFPHLPLSERPIPYMTMARRAFLGQMPLRSGDGPGIAFEGGRAVLAPNSKYVLELNAGAETCGYLRVPVEGGRGAKITIRYAECYARREPDKKYLVKGVRDDWQNYQIIGHEDVYYASGHEDVYEPFMLRTFRFIRIEVETLGEPLVLREPDYIESGYPLEEKSHVESPEAWIGQLWDISKRTLRLCMFETYMDCPYYEQLQYAMDTRLEILFTYMLSADARLARRAIHDFGASQTPVGLLQARYPSEEPQVIPGFSLYWICMVEDYYWQTGDASVLAKYRSKVDGILEWYHSKVGPTGLVQNLGYWEFQDWVAQWEDTNGEPAAAGHGPSALHNLHYAFGLQTAARINRLSGREELAAEYEQRAERIKQAVDRLCWSELMGMYREGPAYEEYTQHTQVWAVLTGLAQGDRAARIMNNALDVPGVLPCSFTMQFYLFRALEKAGLYHRTEALWQGWKDLLELHMTTIVEAPSIPRSDCHGWGALPLYEFTAKVLGVRAGAPGWQEIRIEPKCLYISEMEGEVITPKGMVRVAVKCADGAFSISGQGPAGVPLLVRMPDGEEHALLDGGAFSLTAMV